MNTRATTGEHPRQEPDDLRPRTILLCAAAVVGMVLVTALLAYLLTRGTGTTTRTGTSRYVTADPVDEIAKYQQEKRSQLEAPPWRDEQHFAHIPIEQAMREAARSAQ